jgi:hypothetical protein
VAFPKITAILQSGPNEKDNDDTTALYNTMEHLNLNAKRLSQALHKIHQAIPLYAKKSNHQLILAKVLRSMIWNWINNYPKEYTQLYKGGNRLDGKL